MVKYRIFNYLSGMPITQGMTYQCRHALHKNHVNHVESCVLLDQKLIAERLVKRLLDRGKPFSGGSQNAQLLGLFLARFPSSATNQEACNAIGKTNGDISTPIARLRKNLVECFETDRSLWGEQRILQVSALQPDQAHTLELHPLRDHLSPTTQLWFHQCVRIPVQQNTGKGERNQEPQPTVVLSEPLFFYSASLGAYVRFLEINHDNEFRTGDEQRLLKAARNRLANVISRGESSNEDAKEFVNGLDLVPVRLYLPAGDSYAKTSIRRWFRDNFQVRVGYRPASAVPPSESVNLNLIILASRSSHPLVAHFQSLNNLRLRLTGNGINFDGKDFEDTMDAKQSTRLFRVIVTNWITDAKKVHTYLISNHTRALQEVAQFLVTDSKELRDITDRLVVGDRIPTKFQMAFEVRLFGHETGATVEQMLPALNDQPLIYDNIASSATP